MLALGLIGVVLTGCRSIITPIPVKMKREE
ncbi:hypothetical protein J2S17_002484 [Cytobacillus purgationiresistens]|uniref:Lipoprotein n=1 Tax=Cytobacillus purgationiresistens TaxID=863449 RepID=A0ABU0AH71_9BACI|nr:hypothetical protein [Cytobacillus purgationiresistens]